MLVVDTNILLQLYRVPEATRKEILDILRALGDRLWVPHHVGLEFERNRLGVIASARKQADEILQDFAGLEGLSDKIRALELDKRAIGVEEEPLLIALRAAREKACEVMQTVRESHVQLSHDDPIRDAIHDLYTGRIGDAPVDQGAVDDMERDGQRRFDNLVPPGFRDAGKDAAAYVAKGLRYQRRFGDYVVWRQTVDYVKAHGVSHLMYATLDNKEDWWHRLQGQTVGPLPELVHEMQSAGVEVFWMYNLQQLVEQSKRMGVAAVSDTTLQEVQEVQMRADLMPEGEGADEYVKLERPLSEYSEREAAVAEWLKQRNIIAQPSGLLAPDLVAKTAVGSAGYEVISLRRPQDALAHFEGLIQAQDSIKAEADVSELHVFFVDGNYATNAWAFSERLSDLATKYVRNGRIASITVGYLHKGRLILSDYARHPDSRLHGAR